MQYKEKENKENKYFIFFCSSCGIVIASSRDDRILQREEREKKARYVYKQMALSLIWHFLYCSAGVFESLSEW